MELQIKEIHLKIEETVNACTSILKRISHMSKSSGCSGELCNCSSLAENVNTKIMEQSESDDLLQEVDGDLTYDIKEIKNRVIHLAKNMRHIEEKDRERDANIDTLFQELNSMKRKQDSLQAQIGASTNVIPEITEHISKAFVMDKESAPQRPDNSLTTRYDRVHLQRTKDGSQESSQGTENARRDDEDNIRRKNIRPLEIAETSFTGKSVQRHKNKSGNSSSKVNFTRIDRETKRKSINETQATALVPIPGDCATMKPTYGSAPEPGAQQQPNKECYLSRAVWEVEAKAEVLSAQKTSISELEGAKTILLMDTSASMANRDAWTEAHTFVFDYLKGLEQVAPRVSNKEYVSIVTFGSQTRCLQRYTNDFAVLRASFDNVQLGGPSPLYGGLLMAIAVAISPENEKFILANGMQISTKIILITDGEPTELCLHRGPDVADQEKMDETRASLVNEIEGLYKRDIDLFCVPVGNANMDLLNLILSREQGRRVLNFRDGIHFSKRLFLSNKFRPSFALLGRGRFAVPRGDPEITARDFAHMQEILDDDRGKMYDAMRRQDQNPYEESRNERLLPIGVRVRRGPDWDGGDQDGKGPGTVVGHHLYRDMVWVHWDENDEIRQYNYGDLDRYDVFQVEEPRIPLPGQPLDVGCVVCPGKDWHSDVTEPGSTGVVYRMTVKGDGVRKAVVRWNNGQRAIHSYGDDRIYEIQIYLEDANVVQTVRNTGTVATIQGTDRKVVTSFPAVKDSSSLTLTHQSKRKPNKNKNVH